MDLFPSDPWGLRDYVKLENMLNPPEVSNGKVISEVFLFSIQCMKLFPSTFQFFNVWNFPPVCQCCCQTWETFFALKYLSPVGSMIKFWMTTFWFIKVAWLWCFKFHRNQRTIYSATTFLESCRKVVREIWFEKSG